MSDFECNYLKDLICIYPRGELTLEVMAKIFTAVEKKRMKTAAVITGLLISGEFPHSTLHLMI